MEGPGRAQVHKECGGAVPLRSTVKTLLSATVRTLLWGAVTVEYCSRRVI
jgi:hypothetical protein